MEVPSALSNLSVVAHILWESIWFQTAREIRLIHSTQSIESDSSLFATGSARSADLFENVKLYDTDASPSGNIRAAVLSVEQMLPRTCRNSDVPTLPCLALHRVGN